MIRWKYSSPKKKILLVKKKQNKKKYTGVENRISSPSIFTTLHVVLDHWGPITWTSSRNLLVFGFLYMVRFLVFENKYFSLIVRNDKNKVCWCCNMNIRSTSQNANIGPKGDYCLQYTVTVLVLKLYHTMRKILQWTEKNLSFADAFWLPALRNNFDNTILIKDRCRRLF